MEERNFYIPLFISRFFMYMISCIIFPFTSEIYPTKIRATGIGVANCVGRIGGVLLPCALYIIQCGGTALDPLLFFAILSIAASLLSLAIKHDTTGADLDSTY